MNTNHYCEDHVRAALPCFFYALLYLPPQQRHASMAIFAIYHDISEIPYATSDLKVAYQKQQFWHEEITRFFQNKPRHPATRALQQHNSNALSQKFFHDLLQGCAFDLSPKPILNAQHFQQYCSQHMRALQSLLLEHYGCNTKTANDFCNTLSLAWQYMDTLKKMYLNLQKKRLFLPQQDRVKFKVSDTQLFQAKPNDQTQALFQFYQDTIQQLCQKAETQLHPHDRPLLRPMVIMTHLHLQQWQRTFKNPLEAQPDLLPLKHIWKSWRVDRQERKATQQKTPPSVILR